MSSEFTAFQNLIQPLAYCLNGVINLTDKNVLAELSFMDDERVRYLKPKSTGIIGVHNIEEMIRYTSNLYHLCDCLFFHSKTDNFANKAIHALVLDTSDESMGLCVTDSLMVEFVYKVEELCQAFILWINDRFKIRDRYKSSKFVLMDDNEINASECEVILSNIKFTIGLINKVIEPTERKDLFSYAQLSKNMECIQTILDRMSTYLSVMRVIGCWLCSVGMHKEETETAENKRFISMYLASALAIIEDSKEETSLLIAMKTGITIDMYIQFAELQMMYNEPELCHNYLRKATELGWDVKNSKLSKLYGETMISQKSVAKDNVDTKPSADGKILKKGKPPMKYAEFKLCL